MIAFQRALEMTGHNISNANTPGYSRQVAEFASRPGQGQGNGYIGAGTQVTTIRRVYDQMLGAQLQSSTTTHARFGAMNSLATRLDSLLADPDTGLNSQLNSFFNSVQDIANDPASLPVRQALLGEADGLALRFNELDRQLESLDGEVTQRVSQAVADVNRLADAIARLNNDIVVGQASVGQPPNDLLDQRDLLLRDLASLVSIDTVRQDDGAINVFVASGQNLVTGINANELAIAPTEFDPTRQQVVFRGPGVSVPVTTSMTGGALGGLLEFRGTMLDPARQMLGETAQALAQRFNEQHASGIDLRGQPGGDFFDVAAPVVQYAAGNSGNATAVAALVDPGALAGSDYILEYDGASWSMVRADSGQAVALAGSGTPADPFIGGGLGITLSGTAAAGDRVLIRPSAGAAGSLRRVLDDPQALAMAAPTRVVADTANLGDATLSQSTVVDPGNPSLLATAVIEFTSATTYSVNGAGSFAWTSGEPIAVNGSEFTIRGAPSTGDRYTLEANSGASGDNRNGLLLANVQAVGILDGGTVSVNENYGQLVARVGGATRQVQVNLDAQGVILANAEDAQLSRSGVNLDEEAANMLRYQQAYQAAAQVIGIANTLFDTLLAATRR